MVASPYWIHVPVPLPVPVHRRLNFFFGLDSYTLYPITSNLFFVLDSSSIYYEFATMLYSFNAPVRTVVVSIISTVRVVFQAPNFEIVCLIEIFDNF